MNINGAEASIASKKMKIILAGVSLVTECASMGQFFTAALSGLLFSLLCEACDSVL